MEELLPEEKPELEYKSPNEDTGGIRQRLRDRDLLRKRKAEAEEKETNQVGIQRKRPRVQNRSGTKKRGRPRKTEATVIQEEPAVSQEASAVAVVSGSPEGIADPALGSLTALTAMGSQPTSIIIAPAPLPVFESIQNPVFASSVTPPAPVSPTPALFSPTISVPAPIKDLDITPDPVQDSVPALDPAPDAVLVASTAPPDGTCQEGALNEELEGREALNQAMIEDLGPDEEADILASQGKGAADDVSEMSSFSVPEQNKMSVPTLSTLPPSQEYLP